MNPSPEHIDCLGIGLATLDRFMLLNHYPNSDEKSEALATRVCGGGPVANAVHLLGKLGADTAFFGVLGYDPSGLQIIEEFISAGVDTTFCILDPHISTPEAHIWVDKSTSRRTVVMHGKNAAVISPDNLPVEMIEGSRYLLIDGRDSDACLKAAEISHASGGKVVLDLGSMRDGLDSLLQAADVVIASHNVLSGYSPDDTPEEVLRLFYCNRPETAVVITLGEKGCIWMDATGFFEHPADKVEVVDTTGAGDAFHGGFIYGLIKGWDSRKCIEFASECAGKMCAVLGGRGGVTGGVAGNFSNQFQDMVEKQD